MYDFMDVLKKAEELQASDIHFTVGRPLTIRVKGKLIGIGETALTQDETEEICFNLLDDEKKRNTAKRRSSGFSLVTA